MIIKNIFYKINLILFIVLETLLIIGGRVNVQSEIGFYLNTKSIIIFIIPLITFILFFLDNKGLIKIINNYKFLLIWIIYIFISNILIIIFNPFQINNYISVLLFSLNWIIISLCFYLGVYYGKYFARLFNYVFVLVLFSLLIYFPIEFFLLKSGTYYGSLPLENGAINSGMMCSIWLIFGVLFFRSKPVPKKDNILLFLVSLIFSIFIIYLLITLSRTAILALILTSLSIFIYYIFRNFTNKSFFLKNHFYKIFLGIITILFIFYFFYNFIFYRFEDILQHILYRFDKVKLLFFFSNNFFTILFGNGMDSANFLIYKELRAVLTTDNYFAKLLFEYGICGFIIFSYLIYKFYKLFVGSIYFNIFLTLTVFMIIASFGSDVFELTAIGSLYFYLLGFLLGKQTNNSI